MGVACGGRDQNPEVKQCKDTAEGKSTETKPIMSNYPKMFEINKSLKQ